MNALKKISIAGHMTLLVTLLPGCTFHGIEQNNRPSAKQNKIQTVEVTLPTHHSFESNLIISGTAEPNRQVILYPMESGFVKSIRKDIGDKVKKREVVATLANPELFRKKQQFEAELNGKNAAYKRLYNTYSKTPSITPLQAVDDAKMDYLSAKALLDGINDRINFLQVRAPFAGIVSQRMVDNGAIVQNGIENHDAQPIIELQEVSPIRVVVLLPESDAVLVSKGTKVIVSFPNLTGQNYEAEVSRSSGSLNADSKTMQVEIDLPNINYIIKPGMYAKVEFKLQSRDDVLSLPLTATYIKNDEPYILAVDTNRVVALPLEKGLANKEFFEVLNTNITENTQVIIQGKGLVKPGEIVKPVLTK